ncbi:MAG: PhzF family phenazine biosynthesis protein [Gammaproteobacteria bacterium]
MPRLRIFQVDAFTDKRFGGNPAAVVPLEAWLDDSILQAVAAENNLSETAFFVADGDSYQLRWFTPIVEAKLCGHATLAAAFVIFEKLEPGGHEVRFETLSGTLTVSRADTRLVMNFPVWELIAVDPGPPELLDGLGVEPTAVFVVPAQDNYFVVLEDEAQIRAVRPDFELLSRLHPAGVAVTAPGDTSDCVSRYFAPSYGIPEDPATGSIHCGLVPYWANRLGKREILARQASARGAELHCEHRGDRVLIAGHAVEYLEGHITV